MFCVSTMWNSLFFGGYIAVVHLFSLLCGFPLHEKHSITDGHLNYSHVLTNNNNTAVRILVADSSCICACASAGYWIYPAGELPGHKVCVYSTWGDNDQQFPKVVFQFTLLIIFILPNIIYWNSLNSLSLKLQQYSSNKLCYLFLSTIFV